MFQGLARAPQPLERLFLVAARAASPEGLRLRIPRRRSGGPCSQPNLEADVKSYEGCRSSGVWMEEARSAAVLEKVMTTRRGGGEQCRSSMRAPFVQPQREGRGRGRSVAEAGGRAMWTIVTRAAPTQPQRRDHLKRRRCAMT